VVNVLKFVRSFVSQIPCSYEKDGTLYDLKEVQTEFQTLVRSNFNDDINAGKMGRFATMIVKFDKAVGEVHEFLQMVANGEEMLEN